MAEKMHNCKLINHNEETGKDEVFEFVDTTVSKFQLELGKLVKSGKIPKGILWPGRTGELYKDSEKVNFNEARISLIKQYRDQGYSYEDIAKTLKAPVAAVKAACEG